ncbi:retrovirus-related pol polyprotein from transposon TNT 1-94 [Tanacetum coccineum]
MKADGTIDKYKAKLVIKGYRQREGLDYFDTYLPITRITSIRMILAIAALRNLEVHQMDVKTTFLNGDLEEEIYMNQPKGFIAPGQESKVCRLVKSLYGLKQAPKQWHQNFYHTMLESGFKINECDKCVYVKDTSSGYVILCLYFDDMLIVGNNDKMIKSTKDMLKSKFYMKDIGTRPDLAYAVSRLSRYTSNPSYAHWKAITRVLHYLRYSRDYGLHYDRHPAVIEGYNDANWISNIKDSRSTSGYVFTLGGAAISWKSSKQTVIAKSTMESEFIALDKCGEEAEWLRQFVEDIPRWPKPVTAISILSNPNNYDLLKFKHMGLNDSGRNHKAYRFKMKSESICILYDSEEITYGREKWGPLLMDCGGVNLRALTEPGKCAHDHDGHEYDEDSDKVQ